jgi:hypothetical protein
MVSEQDNAKDEERYSKYQKLIAEEIWPWMQNMTKEGVKITSLADNTGHMIGVFEFEDLEAFRARTGARAETQMIFNVIKL